ncbi:MAG: hypothetical protein LUC17_02690 [Oscillospiraceae bacterium]|nr:hypothetical protein [Oscillospiraceae bacterium]
MAKVTKAFYDASTGKLYRTGEQYDGERTDELAAAGYVAARKPKKKETKTQDAPIEIKETEQK